MSWCAHPAVVLLRRTADGWLLTGAESPGSLTEGDDGFPLLSVGRPVTNAEVIEAIDRERAER